MSHEEVAENSKKLAHKYTLEGNFGRAFSHYLVALNLKPEWKNQLVEEFSTVLCEWGMILEKSKRLKDLFMCYEQAVELYPNDANILNNLGAHLLGCGFLKEAAHYFRKSLLVKPHFIRASHNLEKLSNYAVEAWHFRMLNDHHRNEAFREAIIKKTRQGFDRVLDVGTGTGLLSLFASEGKAKQIYACDCSPIMAEIAQEVFRSNNAPDIKLLAKHSSELQIPGDVREKVSLLMTETFDAGLFGEDVLFTLSHAWKDLLHPPHPQPALPNPDSFGLVIPFGASIYVTGIEADEFANDFHLKKTDHSFLFENCKVLRNCSAYDSVDLSRIKFKCLTETEKIFEINFNDPNEIKEAIKGKLTERTMKCKASGRLDCFAVWFDLCLDEDIVLKTSPLSKSNTAWEQAIFHLPRSITVESNQEIPITVALESAKLNVSFNDHCTEGPKFEASDTVIKTLNNEKLSKSLRQAADKLSPTFNDGVSVLDFYPFPVFGLNFLISRRNAFRDELTCIVPTKNDQHLVNFMAEKYGLKVKVIIKTNDRCLQEKSFDIILLDLIEMNGEIKDEVLQQLNYLTSLLKPGGIVLPQHAAVVGQFVYSDWLGKVSRVPNDAATCGFKIAEYINKYQIKHFFDFDPKSIGSTACCEPFELFSLLDPSISVFEKIVLRRPAASSANALVYWLRVRFAEGCDEIDTIDDIFYHQAAILFSEIELSQEIKFNVIFSNGLFDIELNI